jgi:hypothetical protein
MEKFGETSDNYFQNFNLYSFLHSKILETFYGN